MGALNGKAAIVTGGGSGIGLATARRLAAEGADVLVVDRDERAGEAAAAELGGHAVLADVGSADDWGRVVAEAQGQLGGIDVAFLNAGVTTGETDLEKVTDEQYRRIMGANVDGVVLGARAVIGPMTRRGGGAIVATSSLAGLIAFAPDPVYTLTKHAVIGLVRALAPQLEPRRITVNAVCPGIVDTPLVGEEAKQRLDEAGFPMLAADDIAAAVFDLASGTATGQAMVCQAGRPPVAFSFHGVPGPESGRRPPAGMGDPNA